MKSFSNVYDLHAVSPAMATSADLLRPAMLASGWTVLAETPLGSGAPGAGTFWLWVPGYGEVLVSSDPGPSGRGPWGLHVSPLPKGGWSRVLMRNSTRASYKRRLAFAHLGKFAALPAEGEGTSAWAWTLKNSVSDISRAFGWAIRDGVEEPYDKAAAQVANARGLVRRVDELSERELRVHVAQATDLARFVWALGGYFQWADFTEAHRREVEADRSLADLGRPPCPGDVVWRKRRTAVDLGSMVAVATSGEGFAVLGVRASGGSTVCLLLPLSAGILYDPKVAIEDTYVPVEVPAADLQVIASYFGEAFGPGTLPPAAPLPRGFAGWRPVPCRGRWSLVDGAGRRAAGAFVTDARAREFASRLNLARGLTEGARV